MTYDSQCAKADALVRPSVRIDLALEEPAWHVVVVLQSGMSGERRAKRPDGSVGTYHELALFLVVPEVEDIVVCRMRGSLPKAPNVPERLDRRFGRRGVG
jgi:hypothetical protein